MSVNRDDIQTPEDGLEVATREPKGAKKVADDIQRVKKGTPTVESELAALRQRIAEARGMIAPPEERHCSECAQRWTNGRDAAIRVIEG